MGVSITFFVFASQFTLTVISGMLCRVSSSGISCQTSYEQKFLNIKCTHGGGLWNNLERYVSKNEKNLGNCSSR
jgi:hypothetical protein